MAGFAVGDGGGLQSVRGSAGADVLRVQVARPDLVVSAGDGDNAWNALDRDRGRGGGLRIGVARAEVHGPERRGNAVRLPGLVEGDVGERDPVQGPVRDLAPRRVDARLYDVGRRERRDPVDARGAGGGGKGCLGSEGGAEDEDPVAVAGQVRDPPLERLQRDLPRAGVLARAAELLDRLGDAPLPGYQPGSQVIDPSARPGQDEHARAAVPVRNPANARRR